MANFRPAPTQSCPGRKGQTEGSPTLRVVPPRLVPGREEGIRVWKATSANFAREAGENLTMVSRAEKAQRIARTDCEVGRWHAGLIYLR